MMKSSSADSEAKEGRQAGGGEAWPDEAAEGQARDQYQPSAIAQTTVANVVINSFTGRGSGACLGGDVCRRSVSQAASQAAVGHVWHGCMVGWLEELVGGHLGNKKGVACHWLSGDVLQHVARSCC